MATRSQVILITNDNKAHLYYHHWDGYPKGVGEELRRYMVYSIGMKVLCSDRSMYDLMMDSISANSSYEDENIFDLSNHNHLHADIEYLYIVTNDCLYCARAWGMYEKVEAFNDVLSLVCKEENKLPLDKPIR